MSDSGTSHQNKLRLLREAVLREASARGLKCQEIPSDDPGTRRLRNRLLIEGYKCQIIVSRVQYMNGSSAMLAVYPAPLPRTHWADFLIHVVRDSSHPGNISFFVVPRGDTDKRTTVCSAENWLFQYRDAWALLAEKMPAERLERKTEVLNWKMSFAISKANSLGFGVELIDNTRKGHVQNRLLINGRRCQLVALARKQSCYIALQTPKQRWAQFLIFVSSENLPTFILPWERIEKTISTSLGAQWLSNYADNWNLLKLPESRK